MSGYMLNPENGGLHKRNNVCDGLKCRPVVVVDPENESDVVALLEAYHAQYPMRWSDDSNGVHTRNLQAALRSLIAPPKPDEPQGLGAVVEDAEGHLWVRTSEYVTSHRNDWVRDGASKTGADVRHWDGVAAVKVITEGVTS